MILFLNTLSKKNLGIAFEGRGWRATFSKHGTKKHVSKTLDPAPFRERFREHSW
jgi:hypothetical protein